MKIRILGFLKKKSLRRSKNARQRDRRKNGIWQMQSGKNSKKKGLSLKIRKTEQIGKSGSGSDWIYGLNPVLEAIRSGVTLNVY